MSPQIGAQWADLMSECPSSRKVASELLGAGVFNTPDFKRDHG